METGGEAEAGAGEDGEMRKQGGVTLNPQFVLDDISTQVPAVGALI